MRVRWRYVALWPLAGACACGEPTAPDRVEPDSVVEALAGPPAFVLTDALLGGCVQPSGSIYMVGLPGLKTACTGNSHTPFAWLKDGVAGSAGQPGPLGPRGVEGPMGP